MVSVAGPAMMIGLTNSRGGDFRSAAVRTVAVIGAGVGVGGGVAVGVGVGGVGVGLGVGVGGGTPTTIAPRGRPTSLSWVKFLIVMYLPSLTLIVRVAVVIKRVL